MDSLTLFCTYLSCAPTGRCVQSAEARIHEWDTTELYRPDNPEHVEIIQRGDALPGLRSYKQIPELARKVGFEVLRERRRRQRHWNFHSNAMHMILCRKPLAPIRN